VLIIQGTHDTVVPYTYAQRYHYGYASSTLRLLEGADHGFHQHTLQATALAADFLDEILK
ncbi:MAG: alpha/beta hydrolase, partial [Succinivibrio sp.]|nr:alpha/beta hydrolase [Succinivibrio sp.]